MRSLLHLLLDATLLTLRVHLLPMCMYWWD